MDLTDQIKKPFQEARELLEEQGYNRGERSAIYAGALAGNTTAICITKLLELKLRDYGVEIPEGLTTIYAHYALNNLLTPMGLVFTSLGSSLAALTMDNNPK